MLKIGINGFGRIGRVLARQIIESSHFSLNHINDINPNLDNMAYLLKYDSTYGNLTKSISIQEGKLNINNQLVSYSSFSKINECDWSNCDVIIDASGVEDNVIFSKELIKQMPDKRVIVTHSSNNVDLEVIMGINHLDLTKDHSIVSSSICDANTIAHPLKWIDDEFGIESGSVTTLHPWLSYQNLSDGPSISQANPGVVWKDYALGRSSVDNLIPKNTTAVTATEKVVTSIQDKLVSFSYRIPTAIVSSSDIVLFLKQQIKYDDLIQLFEQKSNDGSWIRLNNESLVSKDYQQEESSGVIDLQWLKVKNNLVKLIIWYDNEWGYSKQVLDLAMHLNNIKQTEKIKVLA